MIPIGLFAMTVIAHLRLDSLLESIGAMSESTSLNLKVSSHDALVGDVQMALA